MTIESTHKRPGEGNDPRERDRTIRYRWSVGAMLLAAVSTVGLAACGAGHKSPHVASLAPSSTSVATGGTGGTLKTTGSSGNSATTAPTGDPTRLLSEWNACMRSHGDPNQAQPTIDAIGAIHVVDPAGYYGPIMGPTGHDPTGAGVTCLTYLTAASTALHGGEPLQAPDPATGDKFAACMRANGVSNYPDPGGGSISGTPGISRPDPKSPSFEKAAKACAQKVPQAASLGGPATLQAGQIEVDNADGSVRLILVGS